MNAAFTHSRFLRMVHARDNPLVMDFRPVQVSLT